MKTTLVLTIALALFLACNAKQFSKCELARHLLQQNVEKWQIGTWVCIAQHESNLSTTAINRKTDDYGIFQISSLYWCNHARAGKGCGLSCNSLLDDDIHDDIQCVKRIFKETAKFRVNGFMAWTVYPKFCKGDTRHYVAGCF
ncbi:unnamed protein product [Brassicogethes aeneus]|uniref:lysozyme n=1 Tax=Brassicogethes aeneus TaxID=1431903 RepID=A0A9P0F937_BRAAE|nr:unnamed protein product [Brassicogethes aeneus]